ncbi:hypothetical protein [Chitinimonas koreensis]|uniref:hypothetical protein n=1 Tax=Chitinimonas koreensis TaxID=356302 RepID=UPI000425E944|nr:hypothetical protein [Chitinimonas koreensis]QNM98543.1 hypothetical protein H9L41_10125 [Chitinimonas koreensis]
MDLPGATLAESPAAFAAPLRFATGAVRRAGWVLAGWLCLSLPALAVGARWHPGWDALALLPLLAWAAQPAAERRAGLAGLLALALGAGLDFRRLPPDALVALCTPPGGADLGLMLRLHLDGLPCALAAMLLAQLAWLAADPQRRGRLAAWLGALAMLPAMLLGMAAAAWLAPRLGLPLTAGALLAGMAAGMLASHGLVPAAHRRPTVRKPAR